MTIQPVEFVALVVAALAWKALDVSADRGDLDEVSGDGITQGPDAEEAEGRMGFRG